MTDVADLAPGPPGPVEVNTDDTPDDPGGSGLLGGWRDRWLGGAPAEAPAGGPVDGLAVGEVVGPPVDEEDIEAFLEGVAGVLAVVFPDSDVPDLWQMTPAELRQMTRYITRIASRRPAVAAAIERADGLMFVMTVGEYVARNMGEKSAAAAARDERTWPNGDDQREAVRGAGGDRPPPAGDVHRSPGGRGPGDIEDGAPRPPGGGLRPPAP